MPTMPTDAPDYYPDFGDYGGSLGGNYDLENYLYQEPQEVNLDDFYGTTEDEVEEPSNNNNNFDDNDEQDYSNFFPSSFGFGSSGDEEDDDPAMYFDEITTTTVPPDMYDYLFSHSRHRFKAPVRKKFDAQALKAAYAEILRKAKDQEKVKRVTRSVFSDVEAIARQFLQRITKNQPAPRVFGLLDRRAPLLFRQNAFVKISLSQFSIVSTGTTGKRCLQLDKLKKKCHYFYVLFSNSVSNIAVS